MLPDLIIFTNGFPLSGKDTFQKAVMKHMYPKKISKISTIDIQTKAAALFGYVGIKDMKGREFLHTLKAAANKFNDFTFKDVHQRLSSAQYNMDFIVFVDSREPKELKRFKEFYKNNAITLLVSRELECKYWGNPSDDGVEKMEYDYVLHNDLNPETMSMTNSLRAFVRYCDDRLEGNDRRM